MASKIASPDSSGKSKIVKAEPIKTVINDTSSAEVMRRQLRMLQDQVSCMQRENRQLRQQTTPISPESISPESISPKPISATENSTGGARAAPPVPSLPPTVGNSGSSEETKRKAVNGVQEKASIFGQPIKNRKSKRAVSLPSLPPLPSSPLPSSPTDQESKQESLEQQKLALESKVKELQGQVRAAFEKLDEYKQSKVDLQRQLETMQLTLEAAQSESQLKQQRLAYEISMTKQELELIRLDLDQSREREKSLREQLKESKEIVAATTNTANGLKMMLNNKDEILNLNKTHCDNLLARAKAATKAKHDAVNQCEKLELRLKELEIKCLGLQPEDVKLHEQVDEQQADAKDEPAAVKQKVPERHVKHRRLERALSKGADELMKHFKQWPNAPAVTPRTSSKLKQRGPPNRQAKFALSARARLARASPVVSASGSRSVLLSSPAPNSLEIPSVFQHQSTSRMRPPITKRTSSKNASRPNTGAWGNNTSKMIAKQNQQPVLDRPPVTKRTSSKNVSRLNMKAGDPSIDKLLKKNSRHSPRRGARAATATTPDVHPDSPVVEVPDLASDSYASSDGLAPDLPVNVPPSTPAKDSSPKDMSPADLPPDAGDAYSSQKSKSMYSSSSMEMQGIHSPSPNCPVRHSSLKVSLKAHRTSHDGSESGKRRKNSKSSAVPLHSPSSISGPMMHAKSFRDASGRPFVVDPETGKTAWADPATKSNTLPPPPPPPSPPDTSISLSAPHSMEHSEEANFDERSNELQDQRHNHRTDTLFGADSPPQSRKRRDRDLSPDSLHATAGAFEIHDIDSQDSEKVIENETISLEGAPMLVQGIHSVRDVQLALNNIKANERVVGSSNVVIVYSTRKRAYFTCAKGDGVSGPRRKICLEIVSSPTSLSTCFDVASLMPSPHDM